MIDNKQLASMIDHTQLKAEATQAQIEHLCVEAREYHFASVCVNPHYVGLAHNLLKDSGVAICTVIGFPLGASSSKIKSLEAEQAVRDGANEVDMVINIGMVKDGLYEAVRDDVCAVVRAAKGVCPDTVVKVIIETCLLTNEEKTQVCQTLLSTGADFVKTSTGFSTGGAKVEDIQLIRSVIGEKMRIKASGGIRTYKDAIAMVTAGADRLGTSNGVGILR